MSKQETKKQDAKKKGAEEPRRIILPDQKHTTRRVCIAEADVDEGVLDLVDWSNALEGIQTIASCQGDPDGTEPARYHAYVMFSCERQQSLRTVMGVIYRAHLDLDGEENPGILLSTTHRFWHGTVTTDHHLSFSNDAALASFRGAVERERWGSEP